MSTLTITTTTTQPLANSASDPSSHLAIQALSQTEQMNQEVTREMNASLKTFKDLFAEMQNTLNATIQENQLLKKEILQLNTKIKENETLHKAEMEKNTQTIATLSQSVTSLTSDLSSTNSRLTNQEKNFKALVEQFNGHGHTVLVRPVGSGSLFNTSVASTPYKI
jgi:predicted RNase H-like nuclease (RuvC/YqgF family)